MICGAMTTATKSDDRHAGRDGGRDAHRTVFDHDAVLPRCVELPGGEKEEVGSGLPPLDLRSAKDVRMEERQQAGYR